MESAAVELLFKAEWIEMMADQLINPLDNGLQAGITNAITKILNNKNEVIIRQFDINLRRDDLTTLNWERPAWLNDNIINVYMEMINKRSRDNPNLPPVFCFNTYMVLKLRAENYDYKGVKNWTKRAKVDIFAMSKVFFPVHMVNHWTLVIVHMDEKKIEYFDSLRGTDANVLYCVQKYIFDEHLYKKGKLFNDNGWRFEIAQGPQQSNNSDCGVFICGYIDILATNYPMFMDQRYMTLFRKKMLCELTSGHMCVDQNFEDWCRNRYRPISQ